ncbi:hypothetical protein CSE45_3800 [Citreicella sp. SE45]|nr:hypothetical protein CSE45_3800 [Citreicella sp. SE45]
MGSVERILGLSQLPSDLILALLLASSAALGSLYAVLRAPNERYIKAFFTGIIAGFIAYLAIKGGRAVLFVETTVVSPLGFNPFSMAFVGVIVGLFTEKAYSVLSDLADEAGERLVRKSKDGGSK